MNFFKRKKHKGLSVGMAREQQGGCFVLVIGSSGMGKSSTLKLLTKDNDIETSDGTKPCTKATSLHRSKDPKFAKHIFIDTQGCEDADSDLTDSQILEQSQLFLQNIYSDGNASCIKILWFTDGATRTKNPLIAQAQYIDNFGQSSGDEGKHDNDNSIWQSVHVIVKQPADEIEERVQSSLDAALKCGAKPGDIQYSGYTCIEWMRNKTNKQKWLKRDKATRMEDGFWTEQDVLSNLGDIINKLKPFPIFFQDSICEHCGVSGDKRFCQAPCHTTQLRRHGKEGRLQHARGHEIVSKHTKPLRSVRHHPKAPQAGWALVHGSPARPRHSGARKLRHKDKNAVTRVHGQAPARKHTGRVLYVHSKLRVHPGKTVPIKVKTDPERVCARCGSAKVDHREVTTDLCRCFGSDTKCGQCRVILVDGEDCFHCNACCGEPKPHREMKSQCIRCDGPGCTLWRDVYETTYRWSCCDKKATEKGCACADCHGSRGFDGGLVTCVKKNGHYSCCQGSVDSPGCVEYHPCCGRDKGARGCCYQYDCCGTRARNITSLIFDSDGCESYYDCCGKDTSSKGCGQFYTCCDRYDNDEEHGCRYACCPHLKMVSNPGCQSKKLDIFECCGEKDPCLVYYDCCQQSKGSPGCVYSYQCCDKQLTIKEHNDESKRRESGCALVCQGCGGQWGISKDGKPNSRACHDIKKGKIQHKWKTKEKESAVS